MYIYKIAKISPWPFPEKTPGVWIQSRYVAKTFIITVGHCLNLLPVSRGSTGFLLRLIMLQIASHHGNYDIAGFFTTVSVMLLFTNCCVF